MTGAFWSEFGILFVASLVGALAILPYSLRLAKGSGKTLKMSLPVLLLLSLLQTAVLSVIAIGLGLLAAHAIGLGAPYIEAALTGNGILPSFAMMIETATSLGIVTGAILLLADLLFLPYWPKALLDTAQKTTSWENFSASFYGGINEELLMRLFGFSMLVWLISRIWHTSLGFPTRADFWIGNVIIAILFGLGHLPALKKLVGKISPVMFSRTLILNAPVGLLCGWLFWKYGIEAAILAHFSADIIYHVFGTLILRRKMIHKSALL